MRDVIHQAFIDELSKIAQMGVTYPKPNKMPKPKLPKSLVKVRMPKPKLQALGAVPGTQSGPQAPY